MSGTRPTPPDQLAHMAKGTVDADGCLVCPWHQSTYDVGRVARRGDDLDIS